MADLRKPRPDGGDVDSYIAQAPSPAQPVLRELRELVTTVAPDAVERLSYGMPYYELHGRLVYFAAHKAHVGVYGLVGAVDAPAGLEPHLAERGTLRFRFGQPLPIDELKSALRARIEQNEGAVRARTTKARGDSRT
jgi:uncharacterized protein YdhG (YjbR/CyaY superfamily)